MKADEHERFAAIPVPTSEGGFNRLCQLPHGLTVEHVHAAMNEFLEFLQFINEQMVGRDLPRLEAMLMQANFSSLVGEFMKTAIPKAHSGLAANRYHNGHPDLVPTRHYPGNSVQHGNTGVEIKGSRYLTGWQGHNPENTFLMVFSFDCNRPADDGEGIPPRPFRFLQVAAGPLLESDWNYSGRSETSRRTITATVNRAASQRMIANHVYRDPGII